MGLDQILDGKVATEDAEGAIELAAVNDGVDVATAGDDIIRAVGTGVGAHKVSDLVELGHHAHILKLLLEGELGIEPFGRKEQAGHATGLIGTEGCEPVANRFHFLYGGAHIYTPYKLVEDRRGVWCNVDSVRWLTQY